MIKKLGESTIAFCDGATIIGHGSIAGKKEAGGPLKNDFDEIVYDMHIGQENWEDAESRLQTLALSRALQNAKCSAGDIGFLFAGDLLNQCIGSCFGLRDFSIPYLGQYGACSTMIQSLILSSIMVESKAALNSACVTSSHFCTAERQYRFPLSYGGQRPQSSQWTVTASGSCVVSSQKKHGLPVVRKATVGKIIDLGVKDQNNMGAAMAPAATDTLKKFFVDTGTSPQDYDMIYTGDLGKIGSKLLYQLMQNEGYDIRNNHKDCGVMIFEKGDMDVHAGGSGCGCCASVLCGHILKKMEQGKLSNILVVATGALLSQISVQQKKSIPCIAHLVNITL